MLAAEQFHAKATTGRVAAVAGRTACFLVCHGGLHPALQRPWRHASVSRRQPVSHGSLMRGDAGGSGADGDFDAPTCRRPFQHFGHADQRQLLAVAPWCAGTSASRRRLT